MKQYLIAAVALLMMRCATEPYDSAPYNGRIRTVTADIGADYDTRIAVTVTPQLDAYTWKEGDRITLFRVVEGAFSGERVEMALTDGAGSRQADFTATGQHDGLVPGGEYIAVHAGALTPLTPPATGGRIGIAMPHTIDMFSDRHEDVEDHLVLWTEVNVSDTESPHIDFTARFNDHTSIMEFEVSAKEGVDLKADHRIASLRASTTDGAHFVTGISVGANGEYAIEERRGTLSVDLLHTPLLSTVPVTVRMPVWWDQSVTSSIFSFGITTDEGLTFTAADRPKDSPIGAGRTVRPIPVVVDSEPRSAADWNGTETRQPSVYDPNAKSAVIASAAELAWIAERVNGSPTQSFAGWSITLGSDIDLAGHDWTPIGSVNARRPFSGTFDGNGYAIYGLRISSSKAYNALFGYCRNATIRDLTIGNGTVSGSDNVAAVCAYAYDTDITGCRNRADIKGNYYVGGIAGNFVRSSGGRASISRCTNSGVVGGKKHTGSIAGSVSSPDCIESCSDRSDLVPGRHSQKTQR